MDRETVFYVMVILMLAWIGGQLSAIAATLRGIERKADHRGKLEEADRGGALADLGSIKLALWSRKPPNQQSD